MNILITICARAGSKRLPLKNVKPFHGEPLIMWTVEQALAFREKWKCDIVVCSDIDLDDCLHGVLPVLNRPPELCGGEVSKLDVIRYVLQTVEQCPCCEGFDAVIDLDVTNPCRKPGDIENALQIFQERWPDCPTLFSAVYARRSPYFNQVEYSEENGYKTSKDSELTAFKSICWDMNASILIMKSEWLKDEKNIHPVCSGSEIYLMEDWQAFDIDTETDFQIAELMFWKHLLSRPLVKGKGIWGGE